MPKDDGRAGDASASCGGDVADGADCEAGVTAFAGIDFGSLITATFSFFPRRLNMTAASATATASATALALAKRQATSDPGCLFQVREVVGAEIWTSISGGNCWTTGPTSWRGACPNIGDIP